MSGPIETELKLEQAEAEIKRLRKLNEALLEAAKSVLEEITERPMLHSISGACQNKLEKAIAEAEKP